MAFPVTIVNAVSLRALTEAIPKVHTLNDAGAMAAFQRRTYAMALTIVATTAMKVGAHHCGRPTAVGVSLRAQTVLLSSPAAASKGTGFAMAPTTAATTVTKRVALKAAQTLTGTMMMIKRSTVSNVATTEMMMT